MKNNQDRAGGKALRPTGKKTTQPELDRDPANFSVSGGGDSLSGGKMGEVSAVLAYPTEGSVFEFGDPSLRYRGSATSTAGEIRKIEIINTDGYVLYSREGTGPIDIQGVAIAPGTYRVYVRATDEDDNEGTSAVISFWVRNQAGYSNTIYLEDPQANREYDISKGVKIYPLLHREVDRGYLIDKVEYWDREDKIGEASSGPYGFRWYPDTPGTKQLRAKVLPKYINEENESQEVIISVVGTPNPIGINITSPEAGAILTAPVEVRVEETGALAGRSVTQIRFLDTTSAGTVEVSCIDNPTFPCSWMWTNPSLGNHNLQANAYLSGVEEPLCTDTVSFRVAHIVTKLWSSPPGVFGNLEVELPGTITLSEDVWRYYKPSHATSYRCESRNIRVGGTPYKWIKDKTYVIKWKSKITKIDSSYGDFVIFQWKSYPSGLQNYPFLMTAIRDEVRLMYVDTDGKWNTLWTKKTEDGEWNSYELTIHLSDREESGWIELKYNNEEQIIGGLNRFHGRTLDGANEPKWGVYNRDNPGHEMEQYVGELEVYIVG